MMICVENQMVKKTKNKPTKSIPNESKQLMVPTACPIGYGFDMHKLGGKNMMINVENQKMCQNLTAKLEWECILKKLVYTTKTLLSLLNLLKKTELRIKLSLSKSVRESPL